jgi:hypothetical protein
MQEIYAIFAVAGALIALGGDLFTLGAKGTQMTPIRSAPDSR